MDELENAVAEDDGVDEALQDLSSDNLINFAQKERLMLLREDDVKGDAKLKLSVLNAISNTAVANKRIASEEKNAMADREVAAALADQLKNLTSNPFILIQPNGVQSKIVAPEVPTIDVVKDETSTALAALDVEDLDK